MKTYNSLSEWAASLGVIRYWVYRRPGIKYEEDNSEFVDEYCHYGLIKEIIGGGDNPILGIEQVEGDEEEWAEDPKVSIIEYYHFNDIAIAKVTHK